MATTWRLSRRAARDLDDIWDYTATRWDEEQAERYLRQIQQAIERIAASPDRGRRRDDIKAGYFSASTGAHLIFYRVGDTLDVVRILHQRMDPARHL